MLYNNFIKVLEVKMLKIIYGKRGSGKTKTLLERANSDVSNKKGDLVFIDKDKHCMLNLHHDIRYMDALEYGKITKEYFLGFLCGVIASDYDIEKIYIDGIPGMFEINALEELIQKTAQIAQKHDVEIIMAISEINEDMPEFIKEFVVEE